MSEKPRPVETETGADVKASETERGHAGYPALWTPRGSSNFGDYSIRDFAAKFLIQLDDFAEVDRYRQVNAAERASRDARPSVVLMGDSITDFWPLDDQTIPGVRLINRGIAGQNSSVMLLRFQADVLDLSPAGVVILAGSNDLRAYAGDPDAITDTALERLSRNLTAMANMAEGCGVAIALSTLPPVAGDIGAVARSPAAIRRVNTWISAFARERGYPLADYHAALVNDEGHLPCSCSEDGLHPNSEGYARMLPRFLGAVANLKLVPAAPESAP